MQKEYHSIILEVKELLAINTDDMRRLNEKLLGLDRLKYQITDYLVQFERELLGSNLEKLESMLDDSKRYSKVLASSTLTKDVLNAKDLDKYARYKKMQNYLINLRGSIEVTRTSLSLEKALSQIDRR